MPAVVREYLETGRDDLRDTARAAARAAASTTAWEALRTTQNARLEAMVKMVRVSQTHTGGFNA
jgi:hypothetical protein